MEAQELSFNLLGSNVYRFIRLEHNADWAACVEVREVVKISKHYWADAI